MLAVFITSDLIETPNIFFLSSLPSPLSLHPPPSLHFSLCGAVDITDWLYPPAALIPLKTVNCWGSRSPTARSNAIDYCLPLLFLSFYIFFCRSPFSVFMTSQSILRSLTSCPCLFPPPLVPWIPFPNFSLHLPPSLPASLVRLNLVFESSAKRRGFPKWGHLGIDLQSELCSRLWAQRVRSLKSMTLKIHWGFTVRPT